MSRALTAAALYASMAAPQWGEVLASLRSIRSPGFTPAPSWRSRPDRRTTVAAMKRAARKRRNRARTAA